MVDLCDALIVSGLLLRADAAGQKRERNRERHADLECLDGERGRLPALGFDLFH